MATISEAKICLHMSQQQTLLTEFMYIVNNFITLWKYLQAIAEINSLTATGDYSRPCASDTVDQSSSLPLAMSVAVF